MGTFFAIFLGALLVAAVTGGVVWWVLKGQLTASQDNSKALEGRLMEFEERMRDRFRSIASEALQANQELLLSQAKLVVENAQNQSGAALQKQGAALQSALTPLQTSLTKLEAELRALEQKREGAYGALNEKLQELSLTQREVKTEARNLVQALRAPQARGAWGELQLKRAVEFAGMTNFVDFQEQVSTNTADQNRLRPDMTIKLPNGRTVVVDAKVPMAAYLSALEATNPDDKKRFLMDHARQLREHFKKLGAKKYFEQFSPSPEFVVLFLHTESLLSAALEQEPQLIEDALVERVIIATPTTLIALLKSVAYGWGETQSAQKAQKIVQLGQELYERVATVNGYWQKVGDSLTKATEAYNQAAKSTETRLLVTARKLGDSKLTLDLNAVDVRPTTLPQSEEVTKE